MTAKIFVGELDYEVSNAYNKSMTIDETTTLEELISLDAEVMKKLARHGLHTLSCPGELYCSLKCAAGARDIPLEHLLDDLNS
ncbi:MAG TPA: hypothetical protein ENN07_01325 [candidate division Zixibacteria bacterium]|nr:hypothetical protein [candidate division Zixibacteria bacterium]